jgi:hypothetical protein
VNSIEPRAPSTHRLDRLDAYPTSGIQRHRIRTVFIGPVQMLKAT